MNANGERMMRFWEVDTHENTHNVVSSGLPVAYWSSLSNCLDYFISLVRAEMWKFQHQSKYITVESISVLTRMCEKICNCSKGFNLFNTVNNFHISLLSIFMSIQDRLYDIYHVYGWYHLCKMWLNSSVRIPHLKRWLMSDFLHTRASTFWSEQQQPLRRKLVFQTRCQRVANCETINMLLLLYNR